jgi:hypothetical protein
MILFQRGEILINLTLPESIYYGIDEVNKKTFMKLYKHKSLKLKWSEHEILDDKEVSGWFNSDKTQYIIKHQEINRYKRFTIVGCQFIIDYFVGLGAVEFQLSDNEIKVKVEIPKPEIQINKRGFVGADLDSHYRVEERLKDMPDNWGVKWK